MQLRSIEFNHGTVIVEGIFMPQNVSGHADKDFLALVNSCQTNYEYTGCLIVKRVKVNGSNPQFGKIKLDELDF